MERERTHEGYNLADFWQKLYGQQRGYLALFSGERVGKRLTNIQSTYFPYPVGLDSAVTFIKSSPERELYQTAHLVSTHLRRKETALPLASLYVDLDGAPLTTKVPPPSLVIESSPGRLQCYWRLERLTQPATGEDLNHRLTVAMGADQGGWDLTQLLRIPGTINHKYETQPTVRIIRDIALAYSAARLRRLLPPVPQPKPLAPVGLPREPLPYGVFVKRRADGQIDRSASLLMMAASLLRRGVPENEIVAYLADRDISLGWNKYSTRRNATLYYQKVVERVKR